MTIRLLGRRSGLLYAAPSFLLREDFLGAAINANTWTVNDTQPDLTVSGGALVSGSATGGANGNPRIVSAKSFARVAGRTLEVSFNGEAAAVNQKWSIGWLSSATPVLGTDDLHALGMNAAVVARSGGTAISAAIPTAVADTTNTRQYRVVLLATGALLYARGFAVTGYTSLTGPWALIWHDASSTTSPLWGGYVEDGSVATQIALDFIRLYDRAAPAPVVEDTFTRADNPTSLGSAETGQLWTAHAGTWGTLGGLGYQTVAQSSERASVDTGIADGIVEVTVSAATNGGVLCRGIDGNNFLLFFGDGTLYKIVAGAFTALATSTAMTAPATLRVVMNGNSIQCYEGNTRRINHTLAGADATQFGAATRAGLHADSTTARFDNFRVWGGLTS